MKKLLAIILIFTLASCNKERYKNIYTCTCDEQKRANEFVQSSIKSANNMSDEEMEDVIHQLERTSIHLNCHQRRMKVITNEGYIIDVLDAKEGEIIYPEY